MTVQAYAFTGCCGINIITGFGKTSTASSFNCDPVQFSLDATKKIIKAQSVGLYMIALNEDQVHFYEPGLLEMGFKVSVNPFYHKNHGKSITVYTYESFPEALKGKVNEPIESTFDKIFEASKEPRPVVKRSRTNTKQSVGVSSF